MNEAAYEQKVADFCQHAGIAPWQDVARSQHIEVDGKVVGLIPDPSEDGRISVYIDLGPVFTERDPQLFEQMLVANLEPRGATAGAFGIYPGNGNAVYHLSVPPQVNGHELAGLVATALEQAGARFETLTRQSA